MSDKKTGSKSKKATFQVKLDPELQKRIEAINKVIEKNQSLFKTVQLPISPQQEAARKAIEENMRRYQKAYESSILPKLAELQQIPLDIFDKPLPSTDKTTIRLQAIAKLVSDIQRLGKANTSHKK